MAQYDGQIIIDRLSDHYQVDFNLKIDSLSSDFATAYEVRDIQVNDHADKPKYALIFRNTFPADIIKIFKIKDLSSELLGIIYEVGKIVNPASGIENLVVILSKPRGEKLSSIIATRGALDETFALSAIYERILSILGILHSQQLTHGNINLDNIYYSSQEGKVFLKESYSEYPGYSQKQIYEPFERMICHRAAKDPEQYEADYYAVGVSVICTMFGEEPLGNMDDDEVLKFKFENGSYEALYDSVRAKRRMIILSLRCENLVKGLLHDRVRDRWTDREVRSWMKRESGQAILSKLHKQTSMTFEFDGVEYASAKYLAHNIHKNWAYAKKYLKVNDLTRWLNLIIKDSEIEKKLLGITRGGRAEVILPDDKLTRIIYTIDPEGPIRYRSTSITVKGLGNYLSYIILNNEKDVLDEFYEILDNNLLDGWISQQPDQTSYKLAYLGWTPRKIKIYYKKATLGFGAERCLYELCQFLPCQSPMLSKNYIITIPALLKAINSLRVNFKEQDPIDRHIAAFICADLEIEDNVHVKQLENFPNIGRMREIETSAILAMAQKKYQVMGLENLALWIRERFNVIIDRLNSSIIKKNMQEKLDDIAKTGDINRLFMVAVDPAYIKKDLLGFRVAKSQYKILNSEKNKLKSAKNIDKLAYRMGLRIAVITSYLICAIAILGIVILNMK